MNNGSPCSNIVFEKEVISHSNSKKTWDLKPFIGHLKAHKVVQQGIVSLIHCSLATLMTNWVQLLTGLLLCWGTPSKNTALWQYCDPPNVQKQCTRFFPWSANYTHLLIRHGSLLVVSKKSLDYNQNNISPWQSGINFI